jgi:EmrB/QacA subfamily drug resistance transporter
VQRDRKWLALVAVALATFMTYLDNNVVNVALPSIQRDLDLSIEGLEWIASAYILVFAGLLLVGGRLADAIGKRTAFLGGLAIFTLSSLAAGLAGSQEVLIGARAVQGIGAALLTPTALALLPALFPEPKERGTAFAIWGGVGALALAVGPLAGGYLSQHVSWGWIFLVNVPIGVVTAGLTLMSLRSTDRPERRRLDVPGLLTSAAALFAFTYALIEGESKGWTSATILGSFGIAAVAAIAFGVVESRSKEPMVDLSFFRLRVFSGGLIALGVWAFGVFGIYFYTAIYLQNVLGFTPTEAGAGFVPMALVMAATATLAPMVERRLGAGRTTALALLLMAGSVGAIARVGEGDGYLDLLPWFLVYGVGGGLLIPLTNVVVSALPAERSGMSSGMLNASREVFGLLGITILGAILSNRQHAATGTDLHRFLTGYQFSLVIAAVVIALGAPIALWSLRKAPAPSTVDNQTQEPVLV